MRRFLIALATMSAFVLAGPVGSASACHWDLGVNCTDPESQPHNPRVSATLTDNLTGAHPDTTIRITQELHEQFITDIVLDLNEDFEVDLDQPAQGAVITDLDIRASLNGAPPTTVTGRITDDNDGVDWPSGGVYRWKVTIDPTAPGDDPVSCPAFADRNAANGHLHTTFTACPELVQRAKDLDASVTRIDQIVKGSVSGGPFVTNPSQGGDYTSALSLGYWDQPDNGLQPPTDTREVPVTIADRVPTTVTVTPTGVRKKTDENHTATAEVKDQGGTALAGANVDFEVTSGPHAGIKCDDHTTGPDGKASCTYTETTGAPTDTIRATATKSDGSASGTATVDWDQATTLNLEPAAATKTITQSHTVTATLLDDDGQPMQGESMSFDVPSGPNQGDSDTKTTDAQGQATFTVPGDGGTGTDQIEASSNGLTDQATVSWVGPTLALTPETATRTVGQTHTVTAAVKDSANQPMQGVTVDFAVTGGPNQGDSDAKATNAQGQATFSYVGDGGEGTDTIEATALGGSDTATVQWDPVPAQVPTTIAMTPERYGHLHMEVDTATFTVTVRDQDSEVIPDVEVRFEIIDGPNAGTGQTKQTDENGNATFSYTGLKADGEGTDTIEARVVGTDLTDTSTARWDTHPCDDDGDPNATFHEVIHTGAEGVTLVLANYEFNVDAGVGDPIHVETNLCVEE